MSTKELTGRKAKKAQRDAERKKTGKKRKREDAEEQAGEEDELKDDFIPLAGGDETTVAKDSKPSKKRKVAKTITAEQETAPEADSATKAKKRRKSKPTTSTPQDGETAATAGDIEAAKSKDDDTASTKPTKSRFILFIGNLPYTATDASITAHFKSIQPFNLRHRTDPKTKKSKGFAFLEFENYDRMKTCLKLYHHSVFDPDAQAAGEKEKAGGANEAVAQSGRRGKKDKSRKINVELTAGGGGKGDDRKEKIKVKNERLEEQRKRRREAEEKAEARREKKQGQKKTGANAAPAEKVGKEAKAEGGEETAGEGMQGVHPARLAQMKKA